MDKVTVNGEPAPETTGSTGVSWEDTPNRHAYCDGEIRRLRAELEGLGARIGSVIAQAIADERERIWQLAVRTRAACYAAEGTGHSFADLIGPEPAAKASQPDAAGTDGPAGCEGVPEPPRDAARPPGTAYGNAAEDPAPLPRRVPGATLRDPEEAPNG